MSMAFVSFGASIRVTLVMLFLGGLMLVSGFGFVREWSALQPALAVLTSIWFVAGLIATGCLFVSPQSGQRPAACVVRRCSCHGCWS